MGSNTLDMTLDDVIRTKTKPGGGSSGAAREAGRNGRRRRGGGGGGGGAAAAAAPKVGASVSNSKTGPDGRRVPRVVGGLAAQAVKAAAAAASSTARKAAESKSAGARAPAAASASAAAKAPAASAAASTGAKAAASGDKLGMSLDDVIRTEVGGSSRRERAPRTRGGRGEASSGAAAATAADGETKKASGRGVRGGRTRGGRRHRLKLKKDGMAEKAKERMQRNRAAASGGATAAAAAKVRGSGGAGSSAMASAGAWRGSGGKGGADIWGKGAAAWGTGGEWGWGGKGDWGPFGWGMGPPSGMGGGASSMKRGAGAFGGVFEAATKRRRLVSDGDRDWSPPARRREIPPVRREPGMQARRVAAAPAAERRVTATRAEVPGTRIRVANVPRNLDSRDIQEAFEDTGAVISCTVDRGVASVVFEEPADAKKAIKTFDRGELNGQTIFCTMEN